MEKAKSVAVLGEREIVLGFKLIGISNCFEINEKNAQSEISRIISRREFSLIIISENMMRYIESKALERMMASTDPLIIFIPMPGGREEESVSKLAKRILGVDIGS
ncbi:MAG: V-type ATP synthase subunit F [Thermoplasmataceae archaeon]|jgi:V/A-type H+-transporting ATPase subunit F